MFENIPLSYAEIEQAEKEREEKEREEKERAEREALAAESRRVAEDSERLESELAESRRIEAEKSLTVQTEPSAAPETGKGNISDRRPHGRLLPIIAISSVCICAALFLAVTANSIRKKTR